MSVPGQITAKDVADFLVAQGMPAVPSLDGKLPAGPDLVCVVTRTGGPGTSLNGVLDNVSFQLRFRGKQNDPGSCEDMAWTADFILAPPPLEAPLAGGMIGSQYVVQVMRVGGAPSFLLFDSARRTHMTGNYIFAVSRVPVAL